MEMRDGIILSKQLAALLSTEMSVRRVVYATSVRNSSHKANDAASHPGRAPCWLTLTIPLASAALLPSLSLNAASIDVWYRRSNGLEQVKRQWNHQHPQLATYQVWSKKFIFLSEASIYMHPTLTYSSRSLDSWLDDIQFVHAWCS